MKTIEELAREAGLRRRDAWVPGIASARLFYSENWNGVTDKDLERFASLVRAQALEEAVPEGWVLVPLDPTRAMLSEVQEPEYPYAACASAASIYKAMIAVAPQPVLKDAK